MRRTVGYPAISRTALALMLAAAPISVRAQDSSAAPITPPPARPGSRAPDEATQLGDIVVTAQRREQRLQDTPVSVTALSAGALAARGIDNLADIGNFAPNLELHPTNRPAGGGSAFAGYIRGVGTGDFQFPTDPGIGLYVDDVYIARSLGGLLSLEDIARVEVLKGPQGTLYGRNTIGGAINVITTDPVVSGDATGMLKGRFGSYGRADGTALVNAPIVNGSLGAKLSASYISNDGFGRFTDGRRYASEGRLILRGGIKWQSDRATLKINADYTRQRQDPPSAYFIGFVPTGTTVAKIARFNQYAAPFVNASLGLPAGTTYDGRFTSTDAFRTASRGTQQDDSDIYGVSAVATFDLTSDISLESITAYRNIDAKVEVDGDQTPYTLQQSRTLMQEHQVSQELQLGGTLLDGRLNFLVGAYAFREKGNSSVFTRSFEGIYEALRAAGLPTTASDVGNTFTTFGLEATSYALFTQESLKLTDSVSVTLGARINRDRKAYSTSVVRPQNGSVVVPLSNAVAEWDSFTPKLGIDWKPTRTTLLYASYSKGFKSGGFGASTVASTPTPRYDPEKLASYEVGVKTSWLNDRLTVNAAGFYSAYRDIQLTVQSVDPVTNANIRTTRNAGGSNIKGFELEMSALPMRGLNVNLGVGHVDARFDTLAASAVGSGFVLNSRVPQIPDWSMNGGVSYGIETGAGRFTLRGDVSYKGSQFLTAADPTSYQKRYALVGARLAWKPIWLDGVELSIDGTNLTDERYAYYKATVAPTGQFVAIPGAPREIYGTVKFEF